MPASKYFSQQLSLVLLVPQTLALPEGRHMSFSVRLQLHNNNNN